LSGLACKFFDTYDGKTSDEFVESDVEIVLIDVVTNRVWYNNILLFIFWRVFAGISGSGDKDDEDEEEGGFEGTPKPMLPYSSMFLFGPTNPYVLISYFLFVIFCWIYKITYSEV